MIYIIIGIILYIIVNNNKKAQDKKEAEAKAQWEQWDKESNTWEPDDSLIFEEQARNLKKVQEMIKSLEVKEKNK